MRAYDLLLRLYPASFRNEYGEEMRRLFARRRRDAGDPLTIAATCASAAWSASASRRSTSHRSR